MKTLLYRLFSAWHFLKIKDKSNFHATINWTIPVIIGLIFTITLCVVDYFDTSLILKDTLRFFADGNSQYFFFPGFFLTALAAIAVFDKKSLDCQLPGSQVTISIRGRGQIVEDRPLTRRLLLSLMFSFLTVHSLTFCIILFLIACFGSYFFNLLSAHPCIQYICLCLSFFILVVIFFQIFLNMLIGLYYLGERFPANYDVEPIIDGDEE